MEPRVMSVLVLASLLAVAVAQDQHRPKGVILMLLDDIGAVSVNAYGGHRSTPNMNDMANDGRLYEYAYSMPACAPTRGSIMSGRYPSRNNVKRNTRQVRIDAEHCLLAEMFRSQSYTTMMLGKWHLNIDDARTIPEEIVSRCNFDYVFAWEGGKAGNRYNGENDYFSNILGNTPEAGYPPASANFSAPPRTSFERVTISGRDEFIPDTLLNMADRFLSEQAQSDNPFFLYYPMLLVHDPISSPPGYDDRAPLQDRFEFQVQYADLIVGRMRTRLQELGLANDTLLLVIGDNGEHRDITTRWGPNALAVQGDKYGVGDEGTRVPFIAEWPNHIHAGIKSQRLVDVTDFLPTLMEATGGSLPAKAGNAPIQGQSFFDDLFRDDDGGRAGRQWIFTEYDRRRAFRTRASRIEHKKGENAIYATQPWYQAQKLPTSAVCESSELLLLANAASEMLHSHPGVITLPGGPDLHQCAHGVVCKADGMPKCASGPGTCEVQHCSLCQSGTSHRCATCANGYSLETVDGFRCVAFDAPDIPTTSPSTTTRTTTSARTTTRTSDTSSSPATTAGATTITVGTGGPCIQNVAGCILCRASNPDRCEACAAGLAPNRKGKLCNPKLPCSIARCAECSPNGRKCITCEDGYSLSNARRRCRAVEDDGDKTAPRSTTTAAPNTLSSSSQQPSLPCAQQVAGCIACRARNVNRCATCAEGLAPNRKGKQCNPELPCQVKNCETCAPNGRRCIACEAGYELARSRRRCAAP